jgi:hypothetical protein
MGRQYRTGVSKVAHGAHVESSKRLAEQLP